MARTKQWVTVFKHNGRDIQILSGAEIGDTFGYRIEPPVGGADNECGCLACTYPTVGDAVNAIDLYGVIEISH